MTIEEIKEWRRTAWMQGTTSVMIDTLLEEVERLEKHNASSDQAVVELDQKLTIAIEALESLISANTQRITTARYIAHAGRSPFTVEFLSKLTAMEFLATIAPNGLVIKREDV